MSAPAHTYTHAHTLTLSRHCMASILGGRPDGVKRQNTRQVAAPAHLIHKSGPENNTARSVGGDSWRSPVENSEWEAFRACCARGGDTLERAQSHTHIRVSERSEWLSLAHTNKLRQPSDMRKKTQNKLDRPLQSSQHYTWRRGTERHTKKTHTHHLEVGHRETERCCVDLWHKASLSPRW